MNSIKLLIITVLLVGIREVALAQCNADAGPNITVCEGEQFTLGGSPAGTGDNPIDYEWDASSGPDPADVANPTMTLNNAGTYVYTLEIEDDDGCDDDDQVTVTVLNGPNAGFNFGPDDECAGTPVNFVNTTTSCSGCTYEWDFDNPASGSSNTSTLQNPTHIFVASGSGTVSFDVTLTVTASNGCTDTQVVEVDVLQSPTAVLNEDVNFTQCLGFNDFYAYVTDNSTPGTNANYNIDWGDGSPDYNSGTAPNALEHIYTGVDIWDLTYTVTGLNGCTDSESYVVTNITNPAIGVGTSGNTLQCGPVEMCFDLTNWSNNHPSTVYIVDFGDGTAPVTYSHPPPASVCHDYATSSCPGSFTFEITADNNCPISSEATITPIQIYTPPIAQFTNPANWCAGSAAPFTNTSIPGYNLSCSSNATYSWNFGDPASGAANTSTAVSPTHVYALPGTYTVTMTATNGGNPLLACGTTTFTGTICIETAPTPVFTVDTNVGCLPLVVNTDNTSNLGVPCSTTSLWDVTYSDLPCDPDNGAYSYSGGTNASSLEPQFTLSSVGTYTINLQMQNSCGTFNDYETVTVNTVPVVALNPLTAICAGSSTNPTAVVDPCNLTITNYAWTFPGGSPATSSSANPGSVTYANSGLYTIGLTATNACGPSSASTTINVNPIPTAGINTSAVGNEICSGQTFSLTGTGGTTYTWTGPGLSSGSGTTVNATISLTGTYVVTAYNGICTDTETTTIAVNPLPIPSAAGSYSICLGQSVVIGANISSGETPYSNWSWTPTATLTGANTPNPTATPVVAGTNNYSVSVTDNNGCVGTGTVPVVVNALPVVNAGPDITLCDQPVATNLTGYSPAGGIWSGSPQVTAAGVFTPAGAGSVTLTYTFTNAAGCTSSDQMVVTVIAPTTANAGPDLEYCQSATAILLTGYSPAGGTWSGTNVTAGGSFTPNTPGSYTLTYTYGAGSCQTQDQLVVTVNALPLVNAGADVAICAGQTAQLSGSVSGGEAPYGTPSWNNISTLSANNILNPVANPATTTTYTLTVSDNNSCTSNDQVTVTVNALPVVNAGPDLSLCDQPIPVTLTGFSPAGGSWSGSPQVTPAGVFTPSGTGSFVLTYTFTNASGCTNSDVMTVNVASATPANAGPDLDACLNAPAINLPVGGTWSGSPLVTPGGVFTPTAVGVYNLTFSTGVGTCLTTDQMVLEVVALPVTNAGPDQTICAGQTVQLNASATSSNGSIFLYTWSGGTVSNSTISNPTATPASTTTYTVNVVDSLGCSDPDQITVFVNALPVVNAGPDITLCDQAIPHQLTGFSPTAGGSGIWTGTGVTTAGVFNSPGVGAYVLTYTFTNANGCVNSDNITVTVVAPVIANAGPDVTLCQNEGVFVPSGYVPAIGGTWSGAGIVNTGSGTFNPNVSGTGTFVITLSYGSGTCFTSDQMEITVLAPPAVNAGPNQSVCGNLEPFNLSGFSPATGGTWEGTGIINASAGTFDPGVLPATYNLLYWYVDPMTGCADSANKQVTVHPVPVANFSVAPLGCTNANVDLINTSTGATTYAWDFGNSFTANGIDPPYTYPDEGIYDIELVAFNAFMCSDTAMNSNEIIDPPSAELSIDPADGCAPLTVTFNNLSVGQYLTYTWDLAIGSSSDPVPAPTIYYQGEDDLAYPISLTATNFCGSDIAEDEILVYPQPVAGFGTNLDVFCSPFTVEFNNTSVGNPDYYLWDFGDGTFSSLEEPGSHVFFADTIPVEYNIWLYLENECGIDSSDYTITVLPNTVTAFFNTNVTEGCSPLQVEFTDFSEGGTYIQYDFDDGTFTGNANPVHVFVDPGFYTIEQFVDNGCSFDTTEITIEVFASPDIDFDTDVDFLCVNESVVFDADPGSAISLTWDFGDGGTSDLSDPAHQYLQNGTFDVVLTGTNANGCESSVTHPVSVYAAPDASFTIPDQVGCSPFTVAFSNATSGGLFYEWDFGDGNTDIDEDPSNTYYNVGSEPVLYTVTLVVENIQLCADTFQMDVIVSPQPTSAFMLSAFESCYFPAEINVSNISVDALAYDWYVNGDFYSDLTEPEFEFSAVGEYDVELVASNQYGCEASSNATFTVHPLPIAALSADPLNGCVNLTVDFSNGSVGAQSYVWDFGDGSTAIGENPQHTYTTPGLYDISLIATTDMGCSDTLEVENYVEAYNLPIAGFNMSPEVTTIYEPIITFIDDSFDASAWFWAFGDGTDATQPNIQHTYAEAGTWHVTLTVWNEHGCTDDVTDVVVIDDIFDIFVPNAFTPDDDDINEYFKPAMSGTAFIERYRFQIFDRWGTIIFETEDPNAAWTGNVRNGEYYAKDDAYNWQVIVQLKGYDEERVYSGHVILVR